MSKDWRKRLDETCNYIMNNFAGIDQTLRRDMCRHIRTGNAQQVSEQVSLGHRFIKRDRETERRTALRALLLCLEWAGERSKITRLWLAVCGLSILAAVLGYFLATNLPNASGAAIDAFAAGALLVMLCDSMIPEAFEHGGNETGLLLVLGFAVAIVLSLLQLAG